MEHKVQLELLDLLGHKVTLGLPDLRDLKGQQDQLFLQRLLFWEELR